MHQGGIAMTRDQFVEKLKTAGEGRAIITMEQLQIGERYRTLVKAPRHQGGGLKWQTGVVRRQDWTSSTTITHVDGAGISEPPFDYPCLRAV